MDVVIAAGDELLLRVIAKGDSLWAATFDNSMTFDPLSRKPHQPTE